MPEDKKSDPQKFELSSFPLPVKKIILNNFIGGIAWAVGATVGLALFFTIISILAKNINFVPIVGSFASDVLNFILATNPNLQK